jgi:hypothetical protein
MPKKEILDFKLAPRWHQRASIHERALTYRNGRSKKA